MSIGRDRLKDETGQTTIFVIGIALVCFAVAGIAVDGTRAWLYRRTLQNAADSSALAGAAELDVAGYYEGGGGAAGVDRSAARRVAAGWVTDTGLAVDSGYAVDETGILVALRGRVSTTFLGLIGVESLPVAVEARAEPRRGEP